MSENIRILLVDDHALVRTGLAEILRHEPQMDIVGQAADGRTAVELAHSLHPDVVIMDARMPLMNGIEATRRIAKEHPEIKVIGFTMQSEGNLCAAMCKAGAAACINKSSPIEYLITAIRDCCPA